MIKELFLDDVRRNPFPMYDQFRTSSPLLRDPQTGLWMVFDYESVKRVLQDPHRFDIARQPNPHIAFGYGMHSCLGAALGRLEARIALTEIFEALKNIRLACTEPWQPRKGLHVHGPASLPIRFEPVATRPQT
jgi:cytochrome P450